MRQKILEKIQLYIRIGKYEMTQHANDEMAEENLDISDIEISILRGKITKIEKDDPRGTKYTIKGITKNNKTLAATVGRFTTTGKYRIITVFEIK